MPYYDPEPDDPQVLVGAVLPAGPDAAREMAVAFAEEFARLGWDRDRLRALFRNPFYAGAHAALAALGEVEADRIIDEAVALWGSLRCVVEDTASDETGGSDVESSLEMPRPRLVGPDGRLRVL